MMVSLALLIEGDADEMGQVDVSLSIARVGSPEEPLHRLDGQLKAENLEAHERSLPVMAPLMIPLDQVPIPKPGDYVAHLRVNDLRVELPILALEGMPH